MRTHRTVPPVQESSCSEGGTCLGLIKKLPCTRHAYTSHCPSCAKVILLQRRDLPVSDQEAAMHSACAHIAHSLLCKSHLAPKEGPACVLSRSSSHNRATVTTLQSRLHIMTSSCQSNCKRHLAPPIYIHLGSRNHGKVSNR